MTTEDARKPSKVTDVDRIKANGPRSTMCWEHCGRWLLNHLDIRVRDNEGDTQLDRAWFGVKKLVEQGILYESVCSTALFPDRNQKRGVITCYTPNCLKEIRRVADVIREVVDCGLDIHFKKYSGTSINKCADKGDKDTALYRHTPDCDLYVKDKNNWKLLIEDNGIFPDSSLGSNGWSSRKNTLSASVMRWNGQNTGTGGCGKLNSYSQVNPPKACLSKSAERPSEVHHKSYIWALNKSGFQYENNDKVGKWIIVFIDPSRNDEGATEADIAWAKVQELVSNGRLHDSKCSTAKLSSSKFAIICYTPDCTDVKEVWCVADTIRSKVVHEEDIYYKQDCAIQYGTDTEGQNTAIYRHTKHCDLYKNEAGIWTEISLQPMVNQGIERADTSRPSEVTSEMAVWAKRDDLPPYENDGKGGKWCIHLDKSVRDGQGDTVLDKAWYEIERLVREGSIYDSKCSTALCHPSASFCKGPAVKELRKRVCKGVIICYTPDHNDITDVKRVATAITTALKSVEVLGPIIYKTDDATRKGLYKIRGDDNITKYRIDPNTGVMSIRTGTVWENVDEHEIGRDIAKSVE